MVLPCSTRSCWVDRWLQLPCIIPAYWVTLCLDSRCAWFSDPNMLASFADCAVRNHQLVSSASLTPKTYGYTFTSLAFLRAKIRRAICWWRFVTRKCYFPYNVVRHIGLITKMQVLQFQSVSALNFTGCGYNASVRHRNQHAPQAKLYKSGLRPCASLGA